MLFRWESNMTAATLRIVRPVWCPENDSPAGTGWTRTAGAWTAAAALSISRAAADGVFAS